MATSGGGGFGGPSLPIGDNPVVSLIVLVVIVVGVFLLITQVFDQ